MKKLGKKVIAVLCAIIMVLNCGGVVSNVKAKDTPGNLTKLSWSDFGFTDDTTIASKTDEAGHWGINNKKLVTSGKSLKNASLRGTIKFQGSTSKKQLQYGGLDAGGNGILIRLEGNNLKVFNMWAGGIPIVVMDAKTAGLTENTFNGTAFELGIDFWQAQDGYKLNLYVNGKKYADTTYDIASVGTIENGLCFLNQGATNLPDVIEVQMDRDKAPEGLTSVAWTDLGFTKDTTMTYNESDWGSHNQTLSGKNILNSSFRGTVVFHKIPGGNMWIQYGSNDSNAENYGIRFALTGDGTIKVYNMVDKDNAQLAELNPTTAGLPSGSTFIDTEFQLGIDVWKSGESDVKVLVYINGKQYNRQAYTIAGGAEKMMNVVWIVGQGTNGSVTVKMDTADTPVALTALTWKDFGFAGDTTIASKIDEAGNWGINNKNLVTSGKSLKNASLRGTIKFQGSSSTKQLHYGGLNGTNTQGLLIRLEGNNLKVYNMWASGPLIADMDAKTAGLTENTFNGIAFELGIDFWQAQDGYKLNLYVNGKKYADKTYDVASVGTIEEGLCFVNQGDATLPDTIDILFPAEKVPSNLTAVKWSDFGFYEETDIAYNPDAYGTTDVASTEKSLLDASFRGEVQFTRTAGKNMWIQYGATLNTLDTKGIRITVKDNGNLELFDMTRGTSIVEITPAKAGIAEGTFLDRKVELGFDIWKVSGTKDVKFAFYVNGVQYDGKCYTISDVADKFDNSIDLMVTGTDDLITIFPEAGAKPVEPEKEQSPEGLKAITWADFSMSNRKYTFKDAQDKSGLIVTSNSALENLLGTSFRGKLTLDKKSTKGTMLLCYASTGWDWNGIRISVTEGGKLRFQGIDLKTSTYPNMVDVSPKSVGLKQFYGQEIELGIDIWKSGNDAKINIFVNGVQCTIDAFVWENAITNGCIGKGCNLIVDNEKDSIQVESIIAGFGESIQPDASLKTISLSSFGIKDGTYVSKHPDLAAQGGYFDPVKGLSLNGTVLDTDICFSSNAWNELRIGGLSNAWEGLVIRASKDKLLLVDNTGLLQTFVPEFAGTQLTDTKINFKMSIQYVDYDNDGEADDVKLGFWFDDVLYKNEFIYLNDYTAKLGSKLGIYIPEGAGTIEIASKPVDNSIDFSIFGFTKYFKAYLKSTGKSKSVKTKL